MIIQGLKPIFENARVKLVKSGTRYIALIKQWLEDGTEIVTFSPLTQINNLVPVPVETENKTWH